MANSSIGSDVFAVVALLIISLLVLTLLRYYLPLRSTPGYLLLPVFLALALPSSIILLVPIDLASAENEEHGGRSRGIWLPEVVILATWRLTYWLTFMLTWVILPILGEYCDSGDRELRARIIYALKSNARYQVIAIAIGIAGLVYFILEEGFHLSSIRGLIMALAYAWGLVLAIGLMGHGLVTLPSRLFKNASVTERLKRLQARAPKIKDKLDESMEELDVLENTIAQLKQRKTGTSRDTQDWIDELGDSCALPESRPGTAAAVRATNPSIPTILTDRYMADLTRKLKRAQHKRARFVDEWATLCQQAQDAKAILDSATSRKLDFGRDSPSSTSIKLLNPTMRFHLHTYILPYGRLGLSAFLAVASVAIIWSEITSAFFPRISLIGLTVLPSVDGKLAVFNQLVAAAWLLYMCATALYALSDVKVWGNRALVKRQTYGESACWYALQVAKLTVPLSYNFITMMPNREVYQGTGFYKLLGQYIDLTPLGKGFSAFFPCFIVVTALASLFNLYNKVSAWFGFGVLEDDSDASAWSSDTAGWREGRSLIERETQTPVDGAPWSLSNRGESLDLNRYSAPRSQPERQQQPPARRLNTVTNEEEDLDESPRHFYQDIAERVKNTFDTAETPEWMKSIGGGIKMPKWMQRDQRDDSDGSGLSRWFGGRPEDGRVRL